MKVVYIMMVVFLCSCEREYCYKCETTVDINGSRSVTESGVCGTVSEVNQYQRAGTYKSYDNNGKIVMQSWTQCKK